MSLELEITDRARRDLRAIVLYIAKRNRDMIVAERFGQRLLDRCREIVSAPGMGKSYRQRTEIRRTNEGAYKIFYQVTPTSVVIHRIWDGRRGRNPPFKL